MNHEITAPELRVAIDDTDEQLGILSLQDALAKARELNLDLVEIAPNANPPVCRIMDFGKYKYREQKKAHKMKMNQHQVQIKEIKLRPVTDEHDYLTKLNKARQFIMDGDKVKFIVQFRGRELNHQERGIEYLERVLQDISDIGSHEYSPKIEGRFVNMVVKKKK